METKEIILISIIPFLFLVWNILNEVAVNKYMQTEDKKYLSNWHLYDSIFRILLFPIVVFIMGDFNMTSIKILLTIFVLYRPLFNMGFNTWRAKVNKVKITFDLIFYLSAFSKIDNLIIRFTDWFHIWKFRFKKYQIVNLIITLIEIAVSILIWK